MVARARGGVPRQFIAISENRRCSILFHLLVPGEKWHETDSRRFLLFTQESVKSLRQSLPPISVSTVKSP
jgi:hypothetical protein